MKLTLQYICTYHKEYRDIELFLMRQKGMNKDKREKLMNSFPHLLTGKPENVFVVRRLANEHFGFFLDNKTAIDAHSNTLDELLEKFVKVEFVPIIEGTVIGISLDFDWYTEGEMFNVFKEPDESFM